MKEKRNSFSGSIGFVLAAAGSAVGLGNIWRFPYLAAKNGGGLFLIVYLVLAVTFGYTLLITEVSIGRLTKQSPLTAYSKLRNTKLWRGFGVLACLVPFLILPYYSAIGGWVFKYAFAFAVNEGVNTAGKDYFGNFISHPYYPMLFGVVFLLGTSFVIYRGVNKGIESISKILMPILLLMIIGIAIYSLTIEGESGKTGMDGLKVYLIPNLKGMTVGKFMGIVADATGQLFYSISVAMGIMIAYGSYLKDKDNLVKSVNRIEIFDTLVAFLAGVMIIPAIVAFMGEKGLQAHGPGLMFIALPKVFVKMGSIGQLLGLLFFVMVLFAALTSSVSILEAVVSSLMDRFGWTRKKAVIVETIIALLAGGAVCLGYNKWYFEAHLPTTAKGGSAQILDILDYVSNYVLMPIVAIGTCILVGWILKTKVIEDEATKNGEKFGRKYMYRAMIKYIAPVLLAILLLVALGFQFG